MKQTWKFIILIIVAAIIVGGIFTLVKRGSGSPNESNKEPDYGVEVTETGAITCLPHKQKTGPQTLECAIGLKGDDGNFYGLKNSPVSQNGTPGGIFQPGEQFRIRGILEKPDESNRYDIVGNIDVRSAEKLSGEADTTSKKDWVSYSADGFQIKYPSQDFSISRDGIVPQNVSSYIPPCNSDSNTRLCIYDKSSDLKGTNFGSAGITLSISNKDVTQASCESASGYPSAVNNETNESINGRNFFVFETGDAAMSHDAADTIYRTWGNGSCYQLDARITSTVYEVYATGTIEKFTDQERKDLRNTLDSIVKTFALK